MFRGNPISFREVVKEKNNKTLIKKQSRYVDPYLNVLKTFFFRGAVGPQMTHGAGAADGLRWNPEDIINGI